jgi:hypothetical protein
VSSLEETAMSDPAVSTAAPTAAKRVVLLSLNYVPARRAVRYANALVAAGVDVDLVVTQEKSASESQIELDPRVRIHPVVVEEAKHPIRRAERLLVFRLPGGALAKARVVTSRSKVTRPVDVALDAAQRGHERVAGGIHHRLFWPAFKVVRPMILARKARKKLQALDIGTADRIVACDVAAVPLGWRLARRYPKVIATTALDLKPYMSAGADNA